MEGVQTSYRKDAFRNYTFLEKEDIYFISALVVNAHAELLKSFKNLRINILNNNNNNKKKQERRWF